MNDIPDAAVEAADAELETSAIYLSDKTIRRILTAALPHLVAERDAEIARLRAALMEVRDQYWTVGPIAEIAIAALEPPGDG
jgi:hypothetical protein